MRLGVWHAGLHAKNPFPAQVMDNAVPYLSSAGGQQQVWRAQFSSLAPVDLKRAMASLGSPNKDMSDSVDARAETRYLKFPILKKALMAVLSVFYQPG